MDKSKSVKEKESAKVLKFETRENVLDVKQLNALLSVPMS